MATPNACNVLRTSGDRPLVIVSDFAATGRKIATFHDLVDRMTADYNIWEVAPIPYGQERGVTGAGQADRWAADIRDSGLEVQALLGFCGGNVYAAALIERIEAWQRAPRLILLDPGLATSPMLSDHVRVWIRRFADRFSPEQLEEAERAVGDLERLGERPLELAERLGEVFGTCVAPALTRAGHSEQAAVNFTRLVTGYLHWLGGAAQLDPSALWAKAPALNSNTPDAGLNLVPPDQRASLVGKVTYFDVPHTDLMRTPEVARTVDALLS